MSADKLASGAFHPREIAKEAINVFAKHGISIQAVDTVFEAIKEEMSRQAVQSVEIKADSISSTQRKQNWHE